MQRQKTVKMPAIAVGGLLVAMALVASMGLAGLAPQQAYAAGKKTVYVVTKTVTTNSEGAKTVTTYEYNAKGLLKSTKGVFTDEEYTFTETGKYAYDKKNRPKKTTSKTSFGNNTSTYEYNTKGWVKKEVPSDPFKSSTTYRYNKKGQLIQSKQDEEVCKFKYDDKGNTKQCTYTTGSYKEVTKYTYDKKGNLVKVTSSDKSFGDQKYKNTYKKKRLKKQVVIELKDNSTSTTTYTYKKKSVPKDLVKMVKGQQKCIIVGIVDIATAHK